MQFVLWNILFVSFVEQLFIVSVFLTCLQHRLSGLERHGWHSPVLLGVLQRTLLLQIVVWPMMSRKFLLRRNAIVGFCSNALLRWVLKSPNNDQLSFWFLIYIKKLTLPWDVQALGHSSFKSCGRFVLYCIINHWLPQLNP